MARLVITLLMLMQIQPNLSPTRMYPGFITGEAFLSYNANERVIYTSGLIDGFLDAAVFGSNAEVAVGQLHTCITGKTNTQLAEIIRRYIDRDPKRWNVGANTLGFEALVAACK